RPEAAAITADTALADPAAGHAAVAQAVHDATMQAHAAAARVATAVQNAKANESPSAALEAIESELRDRAGKMTELETSLTRVTTGFPDVQKKCAVAVTEFNQLYAQLQQQLPAADTSWLTPTGNPAKAERSWAVNPHAAAQRLAFAAAAGEAGLHAA